MIPFTRLADESSKTSISGRNNFRRARLRKVHQIIARPTAMVQDYKSCGVYERNAIVKDVQITHLITSQDFHFKQNILTNEQRQIMLETPSIFSRNGEPAHAANPYHADIGQVQLFFDGNAMHRCKVMDLSCRVIAGRLHLGARIQLIDEADEVRCVDYASIFDYPQRIRFIREIEPETKRARLYLDRLDEEVEEFFSHLMIGTTYNVKILGYKNGFYYVDILDQRNRSVASLIEEKFGKSRFRRCINNSWPDVGNAEKKRDEFDFYPPTITMRRKPVNDAQVKNFDFRGGALEYFKQMLEAIKERHPGAPNIKRKFLRVIVIDWLDPDHLTIQPAELEYYRNYAKFVQAVQNLECVKLADTEYHKENKPYEPGEHVLFKNTSTDPELGKWLRGVVVSRSCFDENKMIVGHTKTNSDGQRSNVVNLMNNGLLEPEDFVYLVRSTDFGYHFRTSHSSMRHLKDLRDLRKIGTWGLRCRLFGVNHALVESHKQLVVQKYSETCRGMMDSWLRERVLDTTSLYYVLLRSDVGPPRYPGPSWRMRASSYDHHFDISLFHRSEPLEDFIILSGPRKTRFDCLNWFLVERGAASDQDRERPELSTNVQLDSYTVNKLVSHNMI